MTEDINKEEKAIKAMAKLSKNRVDVSINPKTFLLNYTQEELSKLENLSLDELNAEEIKLIEETKTNLKANLEVYKNSKLEATLVPLKYRDLQIIKTGVYEAVYTANQYKWDEAVKLRAMIREERTLTVYLALRKKEDITKPYYESLEDVCKETDTTIDELYNIYAENFIMADEERKNS